MSVLSTKISLFVFLTFKYIYIYTITWKSSVGAVKEAIETLRSDNVNAFVLDLRDNR